MLHILFSEPKSYLPCTLFIRDKAEIYINLSLDKYTEDIRMLYVIFLQKNNANPDQLRKPADIDLHCLH